MRTHIWCSSPVSQVWTRGGGDRKAQIDRMMYAYNNVKLDVPQSRLLGSNEAIVLQVERLGRRQWCTMAGLIKHCVA
jgi:hypothetical protein